MTDTRGREFIISDTHFNHGGIIKYCERPFSSYTEMDLHMVRQWQERVTDDDTVYHLGDFMFNNYAPKVDALLDELPGKKILIVGNHDHRNVRRSRGWHLVKETLVLLNRAPKPLWMQHFPPDFPHVDYITLHGHTHKPTRKGGMHHDVGVDAQPWVNFGPVLLSDMLERVL